MFQLLGSTQRERERDRVTETQKNVHVVYFTASILSRYNLIILPPRTCVFMTYCSLLIYLIAAALNNSIFLKGFLISF